MAVDPEIAIAAISAITAIALAFFRLIVEVRAVHKLVNSRMTELLELTRVAATAKGRLTGQEIGQDGLHVAGLVEGVEDSGHTHSEKDVGETGLIKRDGSGQAI